MCGASSVSNGHICIWKAYSVCFLPSGGSSFAIAGHPIKVKIKLPGRHAEQHKKNDYYKDFSFQEDS